MRLDLEQYAETKDRQYLEGFVYQAEAVWDTLTTKQQAAVEQVRQMIQAMREDELDRSYLYSMVRDVLFALSWTANFVVQTPSS